MKKLWNTLFFAAAIIFFPVSCSFLGATGVFLYSELDARDMTKGEEPHSSLFFVVTKITADGEDYYDYHSISRLERFHNPDNSYSFRYATDDCQSDGNCSSDCYDTIYAVSAKYVNDPAIFNSGGQQDIEHTFLMPEPIGAYSEGWARYRYEAHDLSDGRQLIEVTFADDDYKSTSRYIADVHSITPVYSKILDPGYVFISFPIALVLTTLLMFVGKHVRKKWFPKN